jgi:hypothetical protein
MATYYNNFSGETVGQAPSGISSYWTTTGSLKTLAEDGVSGSKIVQEEANLSNLTKYYAINSLADTYEDVEILVKIKADKYALSNNLSQYESFLCVVARGNNTTSYTNKTGYAVILGHNESVNKGQIRLIKYLNSNTAIQIGSTYNLTDNGLTWGLGKWCYIRFYVNGTDLKVKAWGFADTEPASWQIEETDSSIVDPGYLGWGWMARGSNQYVKHRIDYINVVTDGGASPSISGDEGTSSIYVVKSNIDYLVKDASTLTLQMHKSNVNVLAKVLSGNKPAPTIIIL